MLPTLIDNKSYYYDQLKDLPEEEKKVRTKEIFKKASIDELRLIIKQTS